MGDVFFKSGSRALLKEPRISAWLETPACTSQIRKVVPANRPGSSQAPIGRIWASSILPRCRGEEVIGMFRVLWL